MVSTGFWYVPGAFTWSMNGRWLMPMQRCAEPGCTGRQDATRCPLHVRRRQHALDVARASLGAVPDHVRFQNETAVATGAWLAWPAPDDPATAIDVWEHDLAVLGGLLLDNGAWDRIGDVVGEVDGDDLELISVDGDGAEVVDGQVVYVPPPGGVRTQVLTYVVGDRRDDEQRDRPHDVHRHLAAISALSRGPCRRSGSSGPGRRPRCRAWGRCGVWPR